MARKKKMELTKKIMVGFLTAVLCVSGMALMPMKTEAVNDYVDEIKYVEMTETFLKVWHEGGKGTAPRMEGYVFGGWYKDGSGAEQLDEAAAKEMKSNGSTAKIYAKFVPAYVLSVKSQLDLDTMENGEKREGAASMRVVSSLDSDNYQKVGFDILLSNKTQLLKDGSPLETTTIYKGIIAGEKQYEANQIFGSKSAFVSVWRLDGIAVANDAKIINVTPYWITMDGTKVTGLTKYVHVEDGYKEYVSVPINLKTDCQAAAGALQIKCSNEKFEVHDVEYGTVFTEMAHSVVSEGTVRLVGNAPEAGTAVKADGIYANVRFKLKEGSTYKVGEGEFLTFSVINEDFCDWNEEMVVIDASDIQY